MEIRKPILGDLVLVELSPGFGKSLAIVKKVFLGEGFLGPKGRSYKCRVCFTRTDEVRDVWIYPFDICDSNIPVGNRERSV